MKKQIIRVGLLLGACWMSANAAFVFNDFNGADTGLSFDSSSVGGSWVHSSTNMRTAIKSNQLALDIPVTQSANFLLYNTSLETLTATGESFEMTMDARMVGSSIYGGVAFNIQDASNFYAIRIKTGTGLYQVIRVVDGSVSAMAAETLGAAFAANVSYTFNISSDTAYSYAFHIVQTGTTNVLNTTTSFTDSNSNFTNGYGGGYFWTGLGSQAIDAYYDNFRIDNSYTRTQLNVMDFGALGDGDHDDTSAFQDAFDASADVYIPVGTYRVTSTLILPAPFRIVGAGADSTVIQFENMGGFTGNSGIVVETAGTYRSGSYMSDLTIAIKGANGKSAISTPRGGSIYSTLPTYIFERIKFVGDVEDGTCAGLYDYGWARYLDLGDGQGHVCRDIEMFGCYDFTGDPASTTTDSSIGFYLSSVQNEGGLLMPIVDHCFTHYVGVGVQFGYRMSNPMIVNSQFDRCWRGIYSPYGAVTGTDYGVLEAQLHALNINAQLAGVYFAKSAFLDINSVRVTRDAGGYDHSSTWAGVKLVEVDDLKLSNIRVQNDSSSYSNTHIGMWLNQCEWGTISGYNCGANMDRGLWFEDEVHFMSVFGATFDSPSSSSFYFTGDQFVQLSISGDKHTSGTTPYAYAITDSSKSEIKFADWTPAQ